jgi:hypothetical protein
MRRFRFDSIPIAKNQVVFTALDHVRLTVPMVVRSMKRTLPVGAFGVVLSVWRAGPTYDVSFTSPFSCVVTIPGDHLEYLSQAARDSRDNPDDTDEIVQLEMMRDWESR